MYGKLNKKDSKYFKNALKLLRQGNTMLLQLSEKSDIDEVTSVTAVMHDEIESALKRAETIDDFIADGKFVQLTIDFKNV